MTDGRDNLDPGSLPSDSMDGSGSDSSSAKATLVSGFGLVFMAGVVAAAVFFQAPSIRAAGAQTDSGAGAELYVQHCASCHQATGLGIPGTFPPLVGNPAAADQPYVAAVIRDGLSGPLEVLGVQYDTVMPPAVELTDDGEIEALARYVVDLAFQGDGEAGDTAGSDTDSDSDVATGEGDAAAPVVGDRDRGHDLFIGATRFENEGGACVACHTAGSVDNLGGWSLGPDLTDAYQAFGGEAGLSGWLANPPSQTMRPVFADQPLTEAEVADVVAFLDDAATEGKADSSVDRLSVAGLIGLAVLIAGMAVTWRGMRQTYVERLRSGGRGRPSMNGRRDPRALVTAGTRRQSTRPVPAGPQARQIKRSPR